MATSRLLTIPNQQTHDWVVSNKGELLGDLWLTRNIDLESSRGKVRLAERISILQDGATDQTKWGTQQYPRAIVRTTADGTDRWWAMVGDNNYSGGGSPLWNTSGIDPTTGWAQDAILLPPSVATDSMDEFLTQLIVPDGTGDLSSMSSANITTFNISSSTDATPIQITLTVSGTDSGIFTGNKVTIANHTVNTHANGTWTVTRVSAFVFTLNTSTATGGGAGGATGTCVTSAWKLGWWTGNLGQSTLSNGYPRVIKKFNAPRLLLIGNSNFVHTVDSTLGAVTAGSGSSSVAYKRLTFPQGYVVNCIVVAQDVAWIFLCNINNQDAIAARWDGGEQSYELAVPLYDPTVYSATVLDGIPYCVNGKGQLLKFNGQAFEEVDVLPCIYNKQIWSDGQTFLNPYGSVLHRNGMAVVDGMIHILLKGSMNSVTTNNTLLENFSSGIWVYNPKSGLYCKYAIGQYRSTNIEWGAKSIVQVGCLVPVGTLYGRFLIGAIIQADASSQNTILAYSKTGSTTLQRGQFVTSQIHIPSLSSMYVHMAVVRAFWKSLSYSFERFTNATDRVIIKMRTSHDPNRSYKQLTNCSWVTGGSSFTVNSTIGAALANAVVGDEIEVYLGQGAGATAHIVSVVLVSTTYTVTLDEAIPNVSNGSGFECYLNNWVKVGVQSNQGVEEATANMMRNSSWIQLKIELRGSSTSPEFKDVTLNYEPIQR